MFTPRVTHLGAGDLAALVDPSSMTAAQMWKTQPHFRTVVSFMARNIAQLGLHSFERVDDSDRRRDRSSVLAQALRSPDGVMTEFELKFALIGDLCLYDRAYWWATESSETASGWMLRRLPPTWVEPVMKSAWKVDHYRVYMTSGGEPTKIPTDAILAFPGYHPGRMSGSSPTVDALRDTLREQIEAAAYRAQVWKRGGRVSSVLERPKDAPAWSDAARETFREDWYAKFTGRGARAGGTPILEDGMTLKRVDFNAQEQQFVEAAKLSLVTVASAFHINPTMIGQNDGANYSNVREFRKMLYGETLGPLIAQVEDRINTFLLPRMGLDPAKFYVEFNIAEKLQGNFEEQATVISSSVGRPWMTADEARGRFNLPALGGDAEQLVTPLNVLVGGQASPRDSGSQNLASAPALAVKAPKLSRESATDPLRVKAEPREQDEKAAAEVLRRFFKRQRDVVLSRLGAKAEAWWDDARWNDELADDLYALAMAVSVEIAADTLAALGFDADQYSPARTRKFLRAVAESRAGAINSTTRDQIRAALDGDLEEDAEGSTPAGVFDLAESTRAGQGGLTLATTLAAFAVTEAGRQMNRPGVTKTWVVTSGNPRPSHAAMDGETVGIDDTYSNGMQWPGDSAGGVDEVAGCSCVSELTIP
ncbi:MAG: phage portal protein [Nocardioides sp.]